MTCYCEKTSNGLNYAGREIRLELTPVLAKHSKSFNLIDTLAVGVDRLQRNFEPMQRQVEQWRSSQITDERAKLILYEPFAVSPSQYC
jgi:hypothetical protein